MVTIIKTKIAQNSEGKEFVAVKLLGDAELVQSLSTGRFYLTAKQCYVSTTFSPEIANALIGTKLPGTIERVACEPYTYTTEAGEEITLSHRYSYAPPQAVGTIKPNEGDGEFRPVELEDL